MDQPGKRGLTALPELLNLYDMKQSQSGLFPGFFRVRMHLTIINTQKFLVNI